MQHDFILLDRSGSMEGSIWTEALAGINTYVRKLADTNVDTGVTVVVFDSNEPFRIVRDRITPKTFRPLVSGESLDETGSNFLMPRGGTPLNDATMSLVNLAEKGSPFGSKYEKVAIVIMTDGDENSSQEFSIGSGGVTKVKLRLDLCREKGWVVQFLGANFDNQHQAESYGTLRGSTVSTTAMNFASTMSAMADKRFAYSSMDASAGVAAMTRSMDWSDDEKAKLKVDSTS